MIRHIAFLRAINVGGHNVRMDQLRKLFETMKFKNVETFIASGNVIFDSNSSETQDLQLKIERQLNKELGYKVATFLRSDKQIAQISEYKPFSDAHLEKAVAFNIGFLKDQLNDDQQEKVFGFKTDMDDFHINGTEIYWICKTKQSDSKFDAKKLQRAIGIPFTFRTIKTILRLTVKYPPAK